MAVAAGGKGDCCPKSFIVPVFLKKTLFFPKIPPTVRELEVVRGRVKECKARVEDVIEASICAQGVAEAVSKGDMDAAATFIGKYRALNADERILEPDVQRVLKNATLDVASALRTQLASASAAAIATDDSKSEVSRIAGLLAAVGCEREARSAYCGWVKKRAETAARARRLLAEKEIEAQSGTAAEGKRPSAWATALAELLEGAAGEMAKRLPEALDKLGYNAAVWCCYALQDGAGMEAAKVIGHFRSSIQGREEHNLDAVALMCSRVALWKRFASTRLAQLAVPQPAPKPLEEDGVDLEELGGGRKFVDTVLNELVAQYVGLEEKFMVSTVQKAIEMDETDEQSLTGKMVDYVFFVLQKGCHRGVSTLSGDAACAILNIANTCLDSFLQVQQQLIQDTALDASQVVATGPTSGKTKKIPYAVPLNNVAQSGDFVLRLRKEIELAARKHFAGQDKDLAKLEVCWAELLQTSTTFRNALNANLKQVAGTLDPSVREIGDYGSTVSYTLSEKEYSARQLDDDDSWPYRMQRATETAFAPFRSALLPVCWEVLSRALAMGIASRLERLVLSKRYNALGALQMSRDISIASHAITLLCPSGRAEVARLNQMCITIGVENCQDLEELATGSSWRLTPGETRRLLARRVEFTAEQIASVKL